MTTDDEQEFRHPSYAMIQVNRLTGGDTRPLFGSALDRNPTRITIRIMPGVRRHSNGRDWFFGRLKPIVEVHMTPAQFAEMITSPGQGSGVPCTLQTLNGEQVEEPPAVHSEAKAIHHTFKEKIEGLLKRAEAHQVGMEALLESTKIPLATKARIMARQNELARFLVDSAPFLLESFQEAAQRAVQEAKQEVDAFMTHALQTAGLEALRARVNPDADRVLEEFANAQPDPLHPTGRCTCAGEGRCEWCRRVGNVLDEDGRG